METEKSGRKLFEVNHEGNQRSFILAESVVEAISIALPDDNELNIEKYSTVVMVKFVCFETDISGIHEITKGRHRQ